MADLQLARVPTGIENILSTSAGPNIFLFSIANTSENLLSGDNSRLSVKLEINAEIVPLGRLFLIFYERHVSTMSLLAFVGMQKPVQYIFGCAGFRGSNTGEQRGPIFCQEWLIAFHCRSEIRGARSQKEFIYSNRRFDSATWPGGFPGKIQRYFGKRPLAAFLIICFAFLKSSGNVRG